MTLCRVRRAGALTALSALLLAGHARAEPRAAVQPYIEIDQTVFADLKNGGDAVTYTTAAAGVDAYVRSQRSEGQISYRYEHRFGWGDLNDSDVHAGLARGRTWVVPKLLQLEGGALATRTRTAIGGSAANPFIGDPDNVSQLYSVYAGPSLATRVGALDIGAAYRFGYTRAETKTRGFLPGLGRSFGAFDSSTSHVALADVGMRTGILPFGWTVSGGWEREDTRQLDQRFDLKFVRGDVTVPVSPTVALVGGVGYERIRASARDVLRDAGGAPVVDRNGRFVIDRGTPRALIYDQDGFIWDAGVLWRPSRRTSVEARVGRRYGSWSYTGSLSWQPRRDTAVQAVLYDSVQTYGRQVNAALAALPTQFTIPRNPFLTGGCVFGAGDAGAGGCLDPVLQSVASGVYRTRGVTAVARLSRGPLSVGVGAGYAQRRFLARRGVLAGLNGRRDESGFAQGFAGYRIDDRSSVQGNVYATLYDPGLASAPDVLATGATASYFRTLARRLTGTAQLGLYSSRVRGFGSSLTGSALVGLRYDF